MSPRKWSHFCSVSQMKGEKVFRVENKVRFHEGGSAHPSASVFTNSTGLSRRVREQGTQGQELLLIFPLIPTAGGCRLLGALVSREAHSRTSDLRAWPWEKAAPTVTGREVSRQEGTQVQLVLTSRKRGGKLNSSEGKVVLATIHLPNFLMFGSRYSKKKGGGEIKRN